jgi:hypothetical protein
LIFKVNSQCQPYVGNDNIDGDSTITLCGYKYIYSSINESLYCDVMLSLGLSMCVVFVSSVVMVRPSIRRLWEEIKLTKDTRFLHERRRCHLLSNLVEGRPSWDDCLSSFAKNFFVRSVYCKMRKIYTINLTQLISMEDSSVLILVVLQTLFSKCIKN